MSDKNLLRGALWCPRSMLKREVGTLPTSAAWEYEMNIEMDPARWIQRERIVNLILFK